MDQPRRLQLVPLSQLELQAKAPHGFPVSCPTLDLAASWDPEASLLVVCRPPGQVVSKIQQPAAAATAPPQVVAITWKPDGQFLAVAWTDGVVRLMGLENNRVAHRIPVCDPSEATISHIGWATSSITSKPSRFVDVWNRHDNGLLGADEKEDQDDDKEDNSSSPQDDPLPVDLPRAITFLDVDLALPRLSPLPSGSAGSDEDATVFTLRTGIDFLFRNPSPAELDQVNVMVIGTTDGRLHLGIHDSFVIGSFACPVPTVAPLPSPSRQPVSSPAYRLLRHAAHPNVPTHALLLSDDDVLPRELLLVPMDLPFISALPVSLSLVALKLTSLQKLLRYLKQTQLHMHVEWSNARELPARFLRAVESDLGAVPGAPNDIVSALYHTAVTGHTHEPVRAWIVDSLSERGHKRWEKAVVLALGNLRTLIHQNLLPALERSFILVSRLRGLAQFHDARDDIGFSVPLTNKVLDVIRCLTLVAHKILVLTMDELDLFTAFSAWLRFRIDCLAAPGPLGDELTEKEATMDMPKVLAYIEHHLTNSPLDRYFLPIDAADCASDQARCDQVVASLVELLENELARPAQNSSTAGMESLPRLSFLLDYLASTSDRIFRSVAESKKRSVRFGKPARLSINKAVAHMDIAVSPAQHGGTIHAALAPRDDYRVYIFRSNLSITNGISSSQSVQFCSLELSNRKLIDLKFLNHSTLVLVSSQPEDDLPVVSTIPVQSDRLPFGAYDASKTHNQSAPVATDIFDEYRLPEGQMLTPVRMEVRDRSDVRGEIPPRICFLEENRTTWRAFSIPASP